MVAVLLTQRTTVVDDVPFAGAWRLQHRVMTGASSDGRILLKDLADAREGTKGRRADRIRDGIVRSGPSSFRPHEVVLAVLQQHVRTLDVALGGDLFERSAVGERHEAAEVVLEAGDVAVPPAPVHDVPGAVAVLENELVDWLRTVVEAVDQRPLEEILEGSFRLARSGHADAPELTVALDVVGAEEHVVPPVL